MQAAMDWAAWLDAAADAGAAHLRVWWVLQGFLWLTTLGTGAALFGVALAATGLLWPDPRRRALVLPLWLAFGGVQACTWSAKYLFGRARPTFLEGVATAASPSFPSAHSALSAAVVGFVAYAVAQGLPPGRARQLVGLGAAALVGLIAASRVVLGVHYLTDVLAGLLLGGAWLVFAITVARRLVGQG